MSRYRNIGAPIRRDGVVVARRGEVFEPTADELKRKAYKLQPVMEERVVRKRPAPPAPDPEVDDAPDPDDIDAYSTGGGWYTLPGGERVRGKDNAVSRLEELRAEGH